MSNKALEMKDFRERLQQAAQFAGAGDSQATMARSLGLNRQTINLWMHGGAPSGDMILHVARTWGVSPEWLRSGNGDMRPGPFDELPEDERALLSDYRKASPKIREIIRSNAKQLRKSIVTIAVFLPGFMAPKDSSAFNINFLAAPASAVERPYYALYLRLRRMLRSMLTAVTSTSRDCQNPDNAIRLEPA